MKKIVLFILAILLLQTQVFAIEDTKKHNKIEPLPEIQEGSSLYLSECIKYSLVNSPVVRNAYENMVIAKSNVGIEQSVFFPTIGADIGYYHKFNSEIDYDKGNKSQAPMFNVYLQQLIYDFGKSHAKIKTAKFNRVVAENRYKKTVMTTVNNTREKFFDYLLAKYEVEVEKDNVRISRMILDEARKKGGLDYADAQVHLEEANLKLEGAKNYFEHAKSDLKNTMYVKGAKDFDIKKIDLYDFYAAYFSEKFLNTKMGVWHETVTKRPRDKDVFGEFDTIPFTLDEAKDIAAKNSPDLKALDATISAMEQSMLAVKRQFYPNLSGRAGYMYDHLHRTDKIPSVTWDNHQFNIAVYLNASINGMKVKKELDRSYAIIRKAENDYDMMNQDLYYKVEKVYNDVKTEELQLKYVQTKIDRATEALKIAGQDYKSGKIGYLELQASRAAYNKAKLDYIDEVWEYSDSLSSLSDTLNVNLDELCTWGENIINEHYDRNPKKKYQHQKRAFTL